MPADRPAMCTCQGPSACVGEPAPRCRLKRMFSETVAGRPLTIHLSAALERRLKLLIERCNVQMPDDPLDPGDDVDLASALLGCADRGLADDEKDHHLQANTFGDVTGAPRDV